MTGDFPGSGGVNPYISMTAGGAGAIGTGDYTLVALYKPAGNSGIMSAFASSTEVRQFLNDSGHIFGLSDFSSGFGTITSGTWYVVAQTKAAGSNTYRMHVWPYASDGSGTMTHGVATGAGTHGDGSTITELRIGSNANRANMLGAVFGFWDSVLTDGQLDTLKSPNLSAWAALSPKALVSLQNWNGSTGATDVVGSSSFSSLTGTVNVGADPPSFNYSLSSTVAAAANLTAVSTLTAGGIVTELAAAPLTAGATLTAGGTIVKLGAAPLTATATLTAGGTIVKPAAAVLAAAAALTAAGGVTAIAAAQLRAAANLTAAGIVQRFAGALLAVGAQLQATAQVGPLVPYRTAVITPGVLAAAGITPGAAAAATITPGAAVTATLTAGNL